MTIKEFITKKLRKATMIGFLFWLAFGATIIIPKEGNLFFISLIPFAGFFGTIIYIIFFVKCPKCSTPLGQASMSYRNPFSRKTKLNFCPNCGVDFNELIES
jgi:hypothetical protein